MSGIYIHIPFCRKKCNYCDFHFSTQLNSKELMVNSIIKEIELRKNEVDFDIESVYFGGGTPSLLNDFELDSIFNTLYKQFKINKKTEITFEANPDDINKKKVIFYNSLGINRLSIGVQSFNNSDLKFMDRIHTGSEAEISIRTVQDNGFNNISVDLIYGSLTTTNKIWNENLNKISALEIPHVSIYALTVEKNTKLNALIQSKKISNLDEDKMHKQFTFTQDFLSKNLYKQYEFSNYAIENHEAIHNSNYWNNKPYLGIGPSAHSYNGKNSRSWNVSNNIKYIKSIEEDIIPREVEILTEINKFNEYIMTNLRTYKGLDYNYISKNFNQNLNDLFKLKVAKMINSKELILDNNFVKVASSSYYILDKITSELFIDN